MENTSFNRRTLSRPVQVAKTQNISAKVYLKNLGDIIYSTTFLYLPRELQTKTRNLRRKLALAT